MNNRFKLISYISILVMAAFACNLNLGGPESSSESIEVSEAEAEEFVESVDDAIQIAKDTGVVSINISEEQMTSFLVVSMSKQESALLTDPRVSMREGEMEIVGSYDTGAIVANVGIVMEVSVDEDGLPRIEVTSGSLGPLPVPAELLTGVSEVVNQTLTGQIGTMATGFTLDSIDITEGSLSINGTLE